MPIKLQAGQYFSIPEAAAELGCTRGRVHQLIASGEMLAYRIHGTAFIIPESEITRRKANPPRIGRPPKPKRENGLQPSKEK